MNDKLPKDFKLFQLRVLDTCPACNGSGASQDVTKFCPICKGEKIVVAILHEGATLDILLAKVFEDASKHHVNELIVEES